MPETTNGRGADGEGFVGEVAAESLQPGSHASSEAARSRRNLRMRLSRPDRPVTLYANAMGVDYFQILQGRLIRLAFQMKF
jgi:hypothetical protein